MRQTDARFLNLLPDQRIGRMLVGIGDGLGSALWHFRQLPVDRFPRRLVLLVGPIDHRSFGPLLLQFRSHVAREFGQYLILLAHPSEQAAIPYAVHVHGLSEELGLY